MKDKITIMAKKEGYLARSVYKLLSLNLRYNLIKKKDKILDLGCWPGSWIQACLKLDCNITGVDLRKVNIKDIHFIQGDIYDKKVFNKILSLGKFDVVLSDLAPKTTGIKNLDQAKSLDLAYKAFEISKKTLKNNGNFLCKIFQSNELNQFVNNVKKSFKFVKLNKPEASKKRSKEIYLIAKGLKSIQTLKV